MRAKTMKKADQFFSAIALWALLNGFLALTSPLAAIKQDCFTPRTRWNYVFPGFHWGCSFFKFMDKEIE